MKKNIGNDKVIRAMAIGISAMLAASTPLTALAAEGEGEGEGNKNEGSQITPSSTVCDDAQAKADTAEDARNTAKGSTDIVKKDVEDNVVPGEVVVAAETDDSEGKDLAQDVIDAAKKVEDTTVEGGSSVAGAKTDITNADTQLGIAETNDGLSNDAYDKADKEAGKAAEIAEDVNSAMNDANAKMDEQLGELQNATTVADANAAYSELEATANAAQEEFNTKLEAYNDAKNAYDAAVADIAKYEEKYNKAIANADANAAEAQAKLEAAQKNADTLKKAVAAAKDAVDESAKEAMAIAELEDKTRNDGGLNWKNEDKLFIAIMENYYLPEKLDITGATVTRVQGKDNNEYNYFKAVYTENGEEKVKYFNYKMDGKSKDDIVIFEKREVEIFGGAADQYVDSDGNVINTEAGLKDGTVVEVDGQYVEKNDRTDSKTLVSDSEVTGTSKTDVSVDESTKQESWQYDAETGELVKTVTADVTTITYTNETFTSGQSYATAAERDAAAADKKAELEGETGKDATINETETYVATGTYIPVFTETVSVIKDYNYIGSEKDALDKAEEDIIDENSFRNNTWFQNDLEDEGYRLLEDVSYDLTATMTDANEGSYVVGKGWLSVTVPYDYPDDYQVTGTATATYAKVTKETVDFDTLSGILSDLGLSKSKENLEIAAKAQVESTGGIWLDDFQWFNFDLGTAEIRYIKGYQITTGEYATQAEAEAALANAIAQAAENAEEPVRTNINPGNTISRVAYQVSDATITTKHSYTVDYLEKTSEKTENTEIATETYGKADKLTGEIIQNKNYYDAINNDKKDKILLTQKDEAYRAFVDDAKALTGKYARLLKEAKQANEDVVSAQAQVDALKAAIEALKGKSSNATKLVDLEAKLAEALGNRNNAEETLNKILKKLEGAGVTLDDVIDRLTPPTTPGGDDGTTGGGTGTGTTTTTTPGTTTLVAGNVVAAPVATTTTTTTTPAPAAANVVAIEDEDTPLAATVDEAGDDANESGDEDQNAIVAIEDEETPLVASVEKDKVSWWWWLILVILGATGYEMYRKHQEKKKAAAEAEDAE